METNNKDSRRQFLKNASLAALSVGAIPSILKASSTAKANTKATKACEEATEDAYGQGPFYTPNAPTLVNDELADTNEAGTPLILTGQVFNLDCSQHIPGAEIDVWHANDAGDYDNVGFNLRGKTTTNSQGFYTIKTIKPGRYLNGNEFRPSHIHFRITPPGFSTLITQLYFEGDPYIANDFAASQTSGVFDARHRIIPLTENNNGELEGTWDIVVDGNGVNVGTPNIYLDKGMIYKASPNPFYDRVEIQYSVFQKAKASLSVFNMQGQLVANLEQKLLTPQKYTAIWEPDPGLPKGYYFIALKINDLQVHYLKVAKQH